MRQARSLLTAVLTTLVTLFSIGCSDPDPVLLAPLNSGDTILALGDSLTFGTGANPAHAYPTYLSQITGYTVVNAGVPGEISREGLQRLPDQLDRIHPALLILCHGGNDLLRRLDSESLYQNLRSMIELARNRDIAVLLVGVPGFSTFGLSVHPVYDRVADEMNVPYVRDALSDLIKDPMMKSDRIHLNAEGYRRLAQSIAKDIR